MTAADTLLSCASVRKKNPAADSIGTEWPALLDAAEFHGLMPLVYSNIGRTQPDLLPAEAAHRLQQSYLESARRSLFLSARLAVIAGEFEAARIPVVALKGPTLAESLYGDPALRLSFDLDLLIRPEHLDAALSLLAREGATLPPYLARLPHRRLLRLDCEVNLQPERGLPIELHWALAPDDYPFRFDAEVLWRSRQPAQIAGRTVHVLAPPCLLMYLCVHGAKHAWSRLHWLGDVARAIEKGAEWDAALALAAETRCERPFLLGLLLAHDLLDAVVPRGILDHARADSLIVFAARETSDRLRRIPPVEPSSTARTAYNARLARTAADSLKHWAAMFKAPKDEDLKRWVLPSWLFWLYYPLRAQRLAVKYARRLAG